MKNAAPNFACRFGRPSALGPNPYLGGDPIKHASTVLKVFALGIAVNAALFGVKLYVGLSVNSICIWSDAINNLADALSCGASLGFSVWSLRLGKSAQRDLPEKGEQLLAFLLSAVVAFVGVSFAYSSLERLLYPTPVWFSVKYFLIVLLTVFVKLFLFFLYRRVARITGSRVLRVLQADSGMDCVITTATLLSFTLTRWLEFSVDAVFGVVISVFLLVGAAKLLVGHLRALLNVVDETTRNAVESSISACKALAKLEKIQYHIGRDDQTTAFVFASFDPSMPPEARETALQQTAKETRKQTGVALRFVLETEK